MNRICLVEDEQKVASFICKGLEEHGFAVNVAATGAEAQKFIEEADFDVFILDIMLPDTNGIDLCRKIRLTNTQTPILMLSALDQVQNKVEGLQAGADDYLVKPFHFNELLARIEALLRRQNITRSQIIR